MNRAYDLNNNATVCHCADPMSGRSSQNASHAKWFSEARPGRKTTMSKCFDDDATTNGQLDENTHNSPMPFWAWCACASIAIASMSTQGKTCVFSSTRYSLETTRHSPLTANDDNQTLDEGIASGVQKLMWCKIVACPKHTIPKRDKTEMWKKTQTKTKLLWIWLNKIPSMISKLEAVVANARLVNLRHLWKHELKINTLFIFKLQK